MNFQFTDVLILFLANFIYCTHSVFDLKIHNLEVLQNRQIGESLSIELIFEESFVSVHDTKLGHLCLLVNGSTCHCFDEQFSSLDPKLPASCVADYWVSFWLSVSISLHDDSRVIKSLPVLIKSSNQSYVSAATTTTTTLDNSHFLTLVLPLTINDLSRSAILFQSLHLIPTNTVYELLVFVPDYQYSAIKHAILGMTAACNFTTTVHRESVLFHRPMSESRAYPYALQMSVKLLVAKLIHTHFYVTLDADVILLQPFQVSDLIEISPFDGISRAVYEKEDRAVHAHWWQGSETFLNFNTTYNTEQKDGFGVTPAILSTYGSLLVIDQIYNRGGEHLSTKEFKKANSGSQSQSQSARHVMTGDVEVNREGHPLPLSNDASFSSAESRWLDGFGRDGVLWSEYTLYRLVLEHYEVFDGLHVDQQSLSAVEGGNQRRRLLHCGDVWYEAQLPWVLSQETRDACWFSVVQSSTGVGPGDVLKELLK